MADVGNVDMPMGFRPLGPERLWDVRAIPINSSATIGLWSAVALNSSGELIAATAGAGNRIFGVLVGVMNTATGQRGYAGNNYVPGMTTASAGYTGFVVVAKPGQQFRAQADDDLNTLSSASVGERIDMLSNGINTTTGISTGELDASSAGTGATKQFIIVGRVPEAGNLWGDNVDLIVEVNLPQETADSAGA